MEFEKLKSIIADVLDIDPDELTPETTFEELDADSIDLYQITSAIEEQFDIEIPDEAAESIRTVGDAMDKIKAALN